MVTASCHGDESKAELAPRCLGQVDPIGPGAKLMADASETRIRYTLVVPVYRNEATLPALVEALTGIGDELDHRLVHRFHETSRL